MFAARDWLMEPPQQSFSCPVCRMTSHSPEDALRGYCGNCHAFTRELAGLAALMDEMGIAGAAMLAEDGPFARMHNALVSLAADVERAALEAARMMTALALAADAGTDDEMRWAPGDPEL